MSGLTTPAVAALSALAVVMIVALVRRPSAIGGRLGHGMLFVAFFIL